MKPKRHLVKTLTLQKKKMSDLSSIPTWKKFEIPNNPLSFYAADKIELSRRVQLMC